MARPRKLGTDEMISIVDSFFESNGNTGRLKCSFLEEYAVSLGFEVKAYDFRRNAAVRQRMEELRGAVSTTVPGVIAYKSMDVDAMLNRNYTREMMKNSLLELDETWRRVYERATELSGENAALLSALALKNQTVEELTTERDSLGTRIKSVERDSGTLTIENRYLRKALKEYLYPAIANEILKLENVLEQVDTEVTPEAMSALADTDIPSSFSASIATDKRMLSREESLLERMSAQIQGDDNA